MTTTLDVLGTSYTLDARVAPMAHSTATRLAGKTGGFAFSDGRRDAAFSGWLVVRLEKGKFGKRVRVWGKGGTYAHGYEWQRA